MNDMSEENLSDEPEKEPEEGKTEEPAKRESWRARRSSWRARLASVSVRDRNRIFLGLVLLAIAIYVAVFGTLSILRFTNYRASGLDIGIFDQTIWLMSKFKGTTSTIRGMNLFGDHMAPILFFLVPLYWVKANVIGLLLVQTIALGLGALPIYLIARDRLGLRWPALALALAYLAYPALEYMNLFDFHPETLAVPLLLFAVLAVERKRFVWFYICCAGAAITKEDMALAVLVLALVVYFMYDKKTGRNVAIGAFVYFVAMVLLVIPRLGPEGFQYSGRLKLFGPTLKQALYNIVRHPRNTFRVLVTKMNITYTLQLLAPVVFLCLLAPVFLLPALPAFLINIASDFAPQHTITYHYTAALIPFIFVAVIFGLVRIKKWATGLVKLGKVLATVAVIVLVMTLTFNYFLGPSPIAESFAAKSYSADKHIDIINEGLSKIPKDAPTSAQIYLLPHLSDRKKIYMFPQPFILLADQSYFDKLDPEQRKYIWPNTYRIREKGKAHKNVSIPSVQYVAMDTGTDRWPLDTAEYDRIVGRLLQNGRFTPIFDKDGVLILKRRGVP